MRASVVLPVPAPPTNMTGLFIFTSMSERNERRTESAVGTITEAKSPSPMGTYSGTTPVHGAKVLEPSASK